MVATLVVFIFFLCGVRAFCCTWLTLPDLGCVCMRAGGGGGAEADNPQNWAVQTAPKTGQCLLRVDFGGAARSPGPLTLGRRLTLTAYVVAPYIFFCGWRGGEGHTGNRSRDPYRSVEPSVLS